MKGLILFLNLKCEKQGKWRNKCMCKYKNFVKEIYIIYIGYN